ncbi:MAG: molybdopterin-dependent oxidoreductase [Ardenticatenaceae bacterium]|nr:molybdopterin-dependent oxidoreductase [Ardenticatenaceae bacterium]
MADIACTINGQNRGLNAEPGETLLVALRRAGFFSVKHGCDTGECGACMVLLNGAPANTCITLAAQAEGREVTTVESLRVNGQLHPLQQAFMDEGVGAVQCGFCLPGVLLAAKHLLDHNPAPTEDDVRDVLSGHLCRCTGYRTQVSAVLAAAARLRGESVGQRDDTAALAEESGLKVVGHGEGKVDALPLLTGRPVFTDDFKIDGMLHARILLSPHAHARIRDIETSKAEALPGVRAVLTYKNTPRRPFTTAGQSYPELSPYDMVSLDNKVRFVGDRVAVVAAETPEIAERALGLIEVEYEVLPACLTPEKAMQPGAPIIHDEPDAERIYDASRNLAAHIVATKGDTVRGLEAAALVLDRTYRVPQVQQTPLETHTCITYLDEYDRLVVRTSTQVPFHTRRIVANVLGLPVKRVRVIKPRLGGGFGSKQEAVVEDLCGHLTLATGRPVRLEYSRHEEFTASRSRHPQTIRLRTGVSRDGTITAIDMWVTAAAGAYATHTLTVQANTGSKALWLYKSPNLYFSADCYYTNVPPPGAFRGYGAPQGFLPLEVHMDEVAEALGMDPMAFRRKNWVGIGDTNPLGDQLYDAAPGFHDEISSCGLPECVERGQAAIGWEGRGVHAVPGRPHLRRGIGGACAMQGSAVPGIDMGAVIIKINDDGSFNLLSGAVDTGGGGDTILAQIAAEVLGCPVDDIIVYTSDTDFTPFDKGAYASSTTFLSGRAAQLAAERVREQVLAVASRMLECDQHELTLADRRVASPDGDSVSLADIAIQTLHRENQFQIMGHASYMSRPCPPPFCAQFAEVTVDIETGEVRVEKIVSALDVGMPINPRGVEGQNDGGVTQALGYAVCEEMVYDEQGQLLNPRFGSYHIFQAHEMPELCPITVETWEPSGPFGAKAAAEIPVDAVAPAIVNAVANATGVRIRELPLTPERVLQALKAAGVSG